MYVKEEQMVSIPRQPSLDEFRKLITSIDWSKVLSTGYGMVEIHIKAGKADMCFLHRALKLD
jgi:hypothetical protein